MGKHIVLFGEECASKKEIICEKIGFLLFGITKKFNAMSTYCLYKSSAKQRIEEAVNAREKREDIGKKVIDYDSGIADVISEPVFKLHELMTELDGKESEVAVAKYDAFNAQNNLEDCESFVYELYSAWIKKDNFALSNLFESKGFIVHKGLKND